MNANATNVITVDFRPRAYVAPRAVPARSPRAYNFILHLAASVTLVFACWLALLAQLMWGWL
jgi:hypothetical protein